jgi:Kef-type K+ transport system membrane component KefB
MDLLSDLEALLVVVAIAALAPVVAALVPGRMVPQVVLLIVGGILIGPQVLGWASADQVALLSDVGLAFVFLLAGFEIDPRMLVRRPGRMAVSGWLVSLALSVVVVGALAATGFVHAFVPVALALTTTALGTVLPILQENGLMGRPFAQQFLAVGAIGELFPIIAIAVFLGVRSQFAALFSLAAIAVVAAVLSALPRSFSGRRVAAVISEGADTTGQTTLRWSILLLLGLVVLAGKFGLDVVLGAFLAGAVLRRWAPGDVHSLESKLDAVGYGFFIPVFFVAAGMAVDVRSIIESPARMVVFLVLLLLVRGAPVLAVYRRTLDWPDRVPLTFLTATTLPLIVALTQIGLDSGTMLPENAAALVGAGVLSVLLFPIVSISVARRTHDVVAADD